MKIHYTDNYILNPKHRVTVALVGAGGTGSQVLNGLARMDYALYKLGHPGLNVTVYDYDTVSEANIGRQLFTVDDIGRNKAEILTTRINSFFGTDWDAKAKHYIPDEDNRSNIIITCVDNVQSRIGIGKNARKHVGFQDERRAFYWLDFGNQLDRGQVVLGALREVKQPESEKYETMPRLKCVDELFDLSAVNDADSGPSCSLAEALRKQDLFINSFLAQAGLTMLWQLIYNGSTNINGAFVNLKTMNVNPIKL